MKIVIEIDDELYEEILSRKYSKTKLEKAVADGEPLPEGHGRLGDLDALETEMINGIYAGNFEEGYETFAHINDMDDCVDCVRYADTIIEADVPDTDAVKKGGSMTKEDAIKKMESMKQTFIDLHTPQQMKKKESKRVMEAYDMAIKALKMVEIWDGCHGQIIAPRGTFEEIYNDAEDDTVDKIRAEIAAYGSIWVEYVIPGHTDHDIELIVKNVLKQAKEQVLAVIDKYKAESEE